MSAPKSTENKSLADDVENKALVAATEDKAAKPVVDGMVAVIVAHPIPEGRIGNDEELRPGQTTYVTDYLASQLVVQGVARRA